MTLTIGSPAPDFTLLDSEGQEVSLRSLRGKWLVLYFYPKDDTPGCTKEACAFRDTFSQFTEKNAVILGISVNDAKAHQKFITKYDLPFSLLVDPEAAIATAYDSYGLKKFMGKEYLGITRNTFLIDPEGNLAKIYKKVKPETHPAIVLQDIP